MSSFTVTRQEAAAVDMAAARIEANQKEDELFKIVNNISVQQFDRDQFGDTRLQRTYELKDARDVLRKAIQLKPNVQLFKVLGDVHQLLGELELASSAFEAALLLRKDPDIEGRAIAVRQERMRKGKIDDSVRNFRVIEIGGCEFYVDDYSRKAMHG